MTLIAVAVACKRPAPCGHNFRPTSVLTAGVVCGVKTGFVADGGSSVEKRRSYRKSMPYQVTKQD